jgi:hypothetical protein
VSKSASESVNHFGCHHRATSKRVILSGRAFLASSCGFCFEAHLQGMGLPKEVCDITDELRAEQEALRARGCTAPDRETGDLTDFVRQVLPDYALWDRAGYVWGRPGHYPLWAFFGRDRMRSEDAQKERVIRNNKKTMWRACGHRYWPWWVFHESERSYWLPGGPSTGRGYSGCSTGSWQGGESRGCFSLIPAAAALPQPIGILSHGRHP